MGIGNGLCIHGWWVGEIRALARLLRSVDMVARGVPARGLFGWVEEGFERAVAGGGGLVGEDCVYVDLRLLDVRD